MKCINHAQCGNEISPNNEMTYWEATVFIRDRDNGGPNRRLLERTGHGLCVMCSVRLEHNVLPGQESLLAE